MAPSFGLTLYNLRPRKASEAVPHWPERKPGILIWLHAPSAKAARGLPELCGRLIEDEGHSVLVTCPEAIALPANVSLQPPPLDDPIHAKAFLDHWRPSVAVFTEGELRPAILHDARQRGMLLMMADASKPYLIAERDGWFPGLVKSSLQCFAQILTLDDAAARSFRKAGASASCVRITGRLEEASAALRCLEAERASMADILASRPVWLAAGLPKSEEDFVIAAHRAALNGAHRLLLIIAPETPERAPALVEKLTAAGFITATRDSDEEPDYDVEVFITDGQTEMGLWYRLAPVTFIGGSLAGAGALRNPMEAAALGSAIIAGTRTGPYAQSFIRLDEAKASRIINAPRELIDAVNDLLSPDKAARLAQAAWIAASDGAEVTEDLVTTIRQFLEG